MTVRRLDRPTAEAVVARILEAKVGAPVTPELLAQDAALATLSERLIRLAMNGIDVEGLLDPQNARALGRVYRAAGRRR